MSVAIETGTTPSFRTVRLLVGLYAAISIGTLVAIFLMRDNASNVNDAVWIRGTIVAFTSLLMATFAARASKGSGRAYLRLRLASAIMVVAIIVIISLPGTFPMWMKLEQAACGLVLLGVVVLVNGRSMRERFANKS